MKQPGIVEQLVLAHRRAVALDNKGGRHLKHLARSAERFRLAVTDLQTAEREFREIVTEANDLSPWLVLNQLPVCRINGSLTLSVDQVAEFVDSLDRLIESGEYQRTQELLEASGEESDRQAEARRVAALADYRTKHKAAAYKFKATPQGSALWNQAVAVRQRIDRAMKAKPVTDGVHGQLSMEYRTALSDYWTACDQSVGLTPQPDAWPLPPARETAETPKKKKRHQPGRNETDGKE